MNHLASGSIQISRGSLSREPPGIALQTPPLQTWTAPEERRCKTSQSLRRATWNSWRERVRFSSCLLVRSVSMIASLVALSFRPSILSTYASRELLRACRLVTSAVVLKIDFGSGISSPLKISRYLWKKSTISRDLTAFPAICFASRLCGARLSEINSPKCFANLRRLDTIVVFGILVMSHYRPWVHLLFGALEVWILRDGGARVG